MDTIILKIGGALITDKNSEEPLLDKESLERISGEISQAYKEGGFRLILVNGAGSYGHPFCKKTKLDEGIHKKEHLENFAKDLCLMSELNMLFCNSLIEKNVPACPFQPSTLAVMENRRLSRFNMSLLNNLLDIGLVPTLFGTAAYDARQGCSILSGDELVQFVANSMGAKKVIFATDVDGIFDSNPKTNAGAKLIRKLARQDLENIKSKIGESSSIDVTSGMLGKVKEIINIQACECFVISGRKPKNIENALLGKKVSGTHIYP